MRINNDNIGSIPTTVYKTLQQRRDSTGFTGARGAHNGGMAYNKP